MRAVIFDFMRFCIVIGFVVHHSIAVAVSDEEITSGRLTLTLQDSSKIPAPVINTDVEMDIAGLSARVRVVQQFKNDTPYWVEGTYLFPLPEKSAVDSLQMKIGERLIIGEIKEKQEAKKIYQKAKISGKKASLVMQHRPNIFSNSVANIAPFETIEITIEYQQDLRYRKDFGLSIRFPMTMTPRYTPSSLLVESYDDLNHGFQFQPSFFNQIDLKQKSASEPGSLVTIKANIESGFPLSFLKSTSHQVSYNKLSETNHLVKLTNTNEKSDRDFVLNWRPLQGAEPRAAMFSETLNDEHYISLMIMPPMSDERELTLNREVVFVIDTSGSMAGESIEQAKSALAYGIHTLLPGDRFNVIEFNSETDSLYNDAQILNDWSKKEALDFVSRLNADGGTEMIKAMDEALDATTDPSRVRQVIFLTDGAISNESQLFERIENRLGDTRLFTVGIGSAPNAFFMKRAATFGRGSFTFIADINKAETKIRQLFEKISRPVLSHIQIKWPDAANVEMWPAKIPDLFTGEPLWIKAKVEDYTDLMTISGRFVDNLWQTDIPLARGKDQAGIAKLWAREKIAAIENSAFHGRLTDSDKQLITSIALEHHLVSRYTSLIAVDKTPSRIAEQLYSQRVKQVKPKGTASSLSYPKTALTLWLTPTWSLILLILSVSGLFILRRIH